MCTYSSSKVLSTYGLCSFELCPLVVLPSLPDLPDLRIQVLLALAEALGRDDLCCSFLQCFFSLLRRAALRIGNVLLVQLVGLRPLYRRHLVPVKDLDLRHGLDDFQAVVGLLSERVPEEVELLEEGKAGEELEENVQVAQLVVPNQQHLQEFKLADALDVVQLVVLAVDLFDSEVALNVVQVL